MHAAQTLESTTSGSTHLPHSDDRVKREDQPTPEDRASFWRGLFIVTVVISVISAVFFGRYFHSPNSSDLHAHVMLMVAELKAGRGMPTYSWYYGLVYYLSGSVLEFPSLYRVAAIVMIFAKVATACVTFVMLFLWTKKQSWSILATIALMIVMPSNVFGLIDPAFGRAYLGKLTPNVWHNSTGIAALPFYLLAILFAAQYLMRKQHSSWLLVLVILSSTLALTGKPSNALAFIPAFALYVVITKLRGEHWVSWGRALAVVSAPILILALQYAVTFGANKGPAANARLVLAPMATWNDWSKYPLLEAVESLLFPLAVAIALRHVLMRSRALQLAWLSCLAAVGFFVLVGEKLPDGTLVFDGNCYWGVVGAVFLLFLCSLGEVIRHRGWFAHWGTRLLVLVPLALHILFGAWYLVRLAVFLPPPW